MESHPSLPARRRPGPWWRLRRRAFRAVPAVVWVAAVGGLYLLWQERRALTPVQGIAELSRFVVAAPADGPLVSLTVGEGDRVQPGQVIARLEDCPFRLRLSRSRHELQRLRAELQREKARLESQWLAAKLDRDLGRGRELNRLAREVEEARLDRLETFAELEETRIRHRGIDDEVKRHRQLQAGGIVSDAKLVQLETELAALGKRAEELGSILAARDSRITAARNRLDGFAGGAGVDPEPAAFQLEPLQWRIREQEVGLEEVAHSIASCSLVAPGAGVVSEVACRAGEFVRRGQPVLTIVEPKVRSVMAYVPQEMRQAVSPGATVVLELRDRPGRFRRARILAVSPGVVRVPNQLWADPRVEEWALGVRLAALGDELPGQNVRVFLQAQ